MAVVAILGVLATMALMRSTQVLDSGEVACCNVNRRDIELQCRLWSRANGSWPATNLANIGSNVTYFPEGLPVCPVTSAPYTIDASTGRVTGHNH
jgi:hypothetical protein